VPITSIRDRFRAVYPGSSEPSVYRAPGRVNLIGEHTDYNLGLVLPMAIDLDCLAATAPSSDGWLRAYSENLKQGAQWPVNNIGAVVPQCDWSDRVAGIAWALAQQGVTIKSQNVLIDSAVPLGGGLSSSAALGVSLALAFGADRNDLAPLAHLAETDFVGVPCGIMDQFVSANGQAGAAILLDCRTLEWRTIALPPGLAIVVVNSMVKHELGNSAYRTRVAECAEAARILKIPSLRDAVPHTLNRLLKKSMTEGFPQSVKSVPLTPLPVAQSSACESELTHTLAKRARHVITENLRVEAFASAAAHGDLETMGRLAVESHQSLRDDYEVSCPELDFLVETALSLPGVLGARMTGGGFGGSTVNFVHLDTVADFGPALAAKYQKHWGTSPEVHICKPSPGASRIFF
jgi:galactokinase